MRLRENTKLGTMSDFNGLDHLKVTGLRSKCAILLTRANK